MLKEITFEVEMESGPLTVKAGGPDYIAYEEQFGKSATLGVVEYLYSAWVFICWHAMHRQGLTELDFDAFVATTPQLHREAKVEDAPAPLEQTPSTGE